MISEIKVPVQVANKGRNTLWLYAWLALHEGEIDGLSIRELAKETGLTFQEFRTAKKNLEKMGLTQCQHSANTVLTQNDFCNTYENQVVTGGQKEHLTQCQHSANTDLTQNVPLSNGFPCTPSLTISSSTPLKEKTSTTKVEGEKKATPSKLEEKRKAFYEELIPYVMGQDPKKPNGTKVRRQFPSEMVRDFYDHWSAELQKRPGVMLKETEKTFEIGGRLATWYRIDHGRSPDKTGMKVGINLQQSSDKDYDTDGW